MNVDSWKAMGCVLYDDFGQAISRRSQYIESEPSQKLPKVKSIQFKPRNVFREGHMEVTSNTTARVPQENLTSFALVTLS